jgi:hypothetical protein
MRIEFGMEETMVDHREGTQAGASPWREAKIDFKTVAL